MHNDKNMQSILFNEVREILSNLNISLIALEREQTDQNIMKEIMRHVHTLKGLFATTEFEDLTQLCHTAEDAVTELIKLGFVDSDALTILFSFLNKLEDIFSLIDKKLDEYAKTQDEEFDSSALMKSISSSLEIDFSILTSELQTLTEGAIKIGTKYRLIVFFHPDCRLKAARAFQVLSALEDVSKIIFSNPSKSKIEDGAVFSNLNIIILSQEDETSIQEHVFRVEEVQDVQIERIFDAMTVESADRRVVSSIQTVRVQLSQLDKMMTLLGELIIERNAMVQQLQLSSSQLRVFNAMDRAIEDLRQLILRMRLVPLEQLFEHFPRLIREAIKGTNKDARLIISGKQIEVDRTSIDLLNEALIHLVRNAVDHGIEPMKLRREKNKEEQGLIQIIAKMDRNDVVITVEDNGQGIDIQAIKDQAIKEGYIKKHARIDRDGLIALLFLSGFSTRKQITQLSGRGIGLNIAYSNIVEKLNGSINVETQKGIGTRFILRIPASLSIMRALVVKIDDAIYTIPLDNVSRVYRITDEKIFYHNQRPFIVINRKAISLTSVKKRQNLDNRATTEEEKAARTKEKIVVLWEQGNKQIGILVDSILGQQQIVFKEIDRLMSKIQGYAGFTQIGEGAIVPILDPTKLARAT